MRPRIQVITQFYNDEFLAPFFMNHYSFADDIRVFIDVDTTDRTQEKVMEYPNVTVDHFQFPALYEDELLTENFNKAYRDSDADWVILVSSDEFVFLDNPHEYLENQPYTVIPVRLFQVYRNNADSDLDPNLPIREQRMYGNPNAVKGQNSRGTKPIVVRTKNKIKWMPGTHMIWNPHRQKISPVTLTGAHWHMADPCFCIKRRLERQARTSPSDLVKGHGCHNTGHSEKDLLDECTQHRDDWKLL